MDEVTLNLCHCPLGWKFTVDGSGDRYTDGWGVRVAVAVGVGVDVGVGVGVSVAVGVDVGVGVRVGVPVAVGVGVGPMLMEYACISESSRRSS